MSAQSIAKAAQGYKDKPLVRTCATCAHFLSDMKLPEWMVDRNAIRAAQGARPFYDDSYAIEKNKRCGIGGFAVKKMGTCKQFKAKVQP